jgi:hypothetical protein
MREPVYRPYKMEMIYLFIKNKLFFHITRSLNPIKIELNNNRIFSVFKF